MWKFWTGVIGLILAVWVLNAFCFCFGNFRFVSNSEIVDKVVTVYLTKNGVSATPAAVEAFRRENPDCCGVTNWFGDRDVALYFVLGSLVFMRRVEVAVVTELEAPRDDAVYVRYWKVDPCGDANVDIGIEMSRSAALRIIQSAKQ